MQKLILTLAAVFSLNFSVFAQTSVKPSAQPVSAEETKTKHAIFRANKDQILQAQKMLKVTESGKLDPATRSALKTYQSGNSLKATGTLNRATLEKMNIPLTDKQKAIPVSASSIAGAKSLKSSAAPSKGIFRANKGQITEAQKMMKDKGMYSGEQTGKLDAATRGGIKKFQEDAGMKATGTLNKQTLEKMNIALTDKQKAM